MLAYETAAEGHDLEYFKKMLDQHDEATREEQAKLEQAEADKENRKKERAEKASKRKSAAAVDESDDVEMGEAGDASAPSAKKAKATKKRKKVDESEGENDKVRSVLNRKLAATNPLTACQDPQNEAQIDNWKNAQGRFRSEAKERDKG